MCVLSGFSGLALAYAADKAHAGEAHASFSVSVTVPNRCTVRFARSAGIVSRCLAPQPATIYAVPPAAVVPSVSVESAQGIRYLAVAY